MICFQQVLHYSCYSVKEIIIVYCVFLLCFGFDINHRPGYIIGKHVLLRRIRQKQREVNFATTFVPNEEIFVEVSASVALVMLAL